MFDIKTLVIVLCFVFLISSVSIFFAYRQHRDMDGAREWVIGLSLLTMGDLLLFGQSEISPFLSIVLANGLLQAGTALLFLGVQLFLGHKPNYGLVIGVFLVLWLPFYGLYQETFYIDYRIHLSNTSHSIFTISAGFLLIKHYVLFKKSSFAVASVGFLVQAGASIQRSVVMIIDPDKVGLSLLLGDTNALFFFLIIISYILITIGLLMLISERLQSRLLLALNTEQRARQEQRNFWAMLAHEFKTPLGTITNSAQLIEGLESSSNVLSVDALERIQKAAKRLSHMVDRSLMDQWANANVDAIELVRLDLIACLESLAMEYKVLCEIECCTQKMFVNGSPQLLSTAISSLIDNALKYGNNRAKCKISLRLNSDGEAVVDIFNDGNEIPREYRTRIFEKFYRAPEHVDVEGGGLGLYITKRIVHLHGASIELISNQGSTLRITIAQAKEAV